MPKVEIRHNGAYSADTVEVVYEDNTAREFEWSKINPYELQIVLQDLGHEVELVDFEFDHDI